MIVEISIMPLGPSSHTSDELAEALKIIDASGLPYQFTPSGTCIEGEWDEIMPIVRKCHERVRMKSSHVVTLVKIEDEEGMNDKLNQYVAAVEEKVGHTLRRSTSTHIVDRRGQDARTSISTSAEASVAPESR